MVNQMSDLKATGMTLESIAGMPSSRPVNKESAQQERLNEIVRNSLSSVAGGLGIIYTVLAIGHIVGLHKWHHHVRQPAWRGYRISSGVSTQRQEQHHPSLTKKSVGEKANLGR
jgi:hypothetical protein